MKNEIKFIQLNQKLISKMPEGYDESHPLEWYVKIYCDRVVADDYKDDFMKNVSPDTIRERLKDRDFYTYNYVGRQNGERVCYQMKACKVNNSENHFVVGFADIDDIARETEAREKELKEALAQAEEGNRIKTDFLAKISSDLMSPIKKITASAKSVANKGCEEENASETIILEAEKLETKIKEMLDIGSIRENKITFANKPFDINAALDNVVGSAHELQLHKTKEFVQTRQIVHDMVIGDGSRLTEMVKNIALVALKSTPEGGVVHGNIIEIQVLNRKAYYDISVEFPGEAIKEADMERINSGIMDEDFEYTGLSITKIMTEMMGGKMEIENKISGHIVVTLHLAYNFER